MLKKVQEIARGEIAGIKSTVLLLKIAAIIIFPAGLAIWVGMFGASAAKYPFIFWSGVTFALVFQVYFL